METGIGQAFEKGFGGQSKAPVPLRGHGRLLSRHGVKMASQRYCPGYGVCSRIDYTGEVERVSGDKDLGVAVPEPPSRKSWSGS